MTAATHAQALTAAADALARATIGNAGMLPISELYSITAELVDGCRNLAQVVAQLVAHVDARSAAVPMRVDDIGAQLYGTPDNTQAEAKATLYRASVLFDVSLCRFAQALSPLAALAETGGRR